MAAGYKMALSCQDGRHVDPAKVRDTNCHHIANSIPNNGWTPKYYTKLAFMLKRNVRCDIVLVSVRCGSTIHQLPSRTTFEAILTPHVHSRAEHISSSHIYRRHQSSGNCGIIKYSIIHKWISLPGVIIKNVPKFVSGRYGIKFFIFIIFQEF